LSTITPEAGSTNNGNGNRRTVDHISQAGFTRVVLLDRGRNRDLSVQENY
jgi:hypothetical protein